MIKSAIVVCAAGLLTCSSSADALHVGSAFVFLDPAPNSFWHTATGATMEVSVDMPPGARKASLSVSAPGYEQFYPDVPAGWFSFSVPEPNSPESENVYDLTLRFDDGTVLTSRIGVIQGVGCGGGSARCLLDMESRMWRKVVRRAVIPIAYGTESLTIDGRAVTDFGLEGCQGWYPIAGFETGVGRHMEISGMESACTVDLIGGMAGLWFFVK